MDRQESFARATESRSARGDRRHSGWNGSKTRVADRLEVRASRAVRPRQWPVAETVHTPGSAVEAAIARLAAEAVLEKLRRGVMIIDRGARLRFANAAALSMLRRHDAFWATCDGRLLLADGGAQHRLALYLGAPRGCRVESMPLRLERGGRLGPYRVLVAPLEQPALRWLLNGSGPLYVVLVYEPHAGRNVPERILREVYGLTGAETQVASSLFQGRSMSEVAHDLEVSIHTVRTHLKHIFDKCEVDSQAELMQLLALGPRTL